VHKVVASCVCVQLAIFLSKSPLFFIGAWLERVWLKGHGICFFIEKDPAVSAVVRVRWGAKSANPVGSGLVANNSNEDNLNKSAMRAGFRRDSYSILPESKKVAYDRPEIALNLIRCLLFESWHDPRQDQV
jgi:hypothetical protein